MSTEHTHSDYLTSSWDGDSGGWKGNRIFDSSFNCLHIENLSCTHGFHLNMLHLLYHSLDSICCTPQENWNLPKEERMTLNWIGDLWRKQWVCRDYSNLLLMSAWISNFRDLGRRWIGQNTCYAVWWLKFDLQNPQKCWTGIVSHLQSQFLGDEDKLSRVNWQAKLAKLAISWFI